MLDELLTKIQAKTGLTPEQSKAGLGLVLKLAKEKLGPNFAKVSAALPGAEALIASAPQAGGLAGMASGLLGSFGGGAGKLAGLASMLGAAQKVGLNQEQLTGIGKQAAEYLQAKGGPAVGDLVKKLLV
jgi:hypothetical protein